MTLHEWRLDEGLTLQRLADALGISEETARRYALPETDPMSRMPDRQMLRKIFSVTGGKVTPNDFVGVE